MEKDERMRDMAANDVYEFSADGNACIIKEPRTPRFWYNYLWNEDRYCAQVSQIGHGRSYYLSEKADMCMMNKDDARYVYLRDEETKESWNIGMGPLNTQVEDYQCTHAIGYSLLQSKYHGIEGSWQIFVPQRGYHEVWTLNLKNTGDKERVLSVFSAVSFSLEGFSYPRYYEMYRCMNTAFDKELNGIYCDSAHPFAPHGRYHGFLASSEPVFAYDGDLTAFCGPTNTITELDASATALFSRPDVVMEGRDCTNSEAALFILGGVLQHKITLKPGESKEIHLAFGISESREEARGVARAIRGGTVDMAYAEQELSHILLSGDTSNKRSAREPVCSVKSEFRKAQEAYFHKYASLSVQTPDEKINHVMNNWAKKQVDFCIVGKKACGTIYRLPWLC